LALLESAPASPERLCLEWALCLARLWRSEDRRKEARTLLAGICAWFAEGFDTVDLVEARALLDELG